MMLSLIDKLANQLITLIIPLITFRFIFDYARILLFKD